MVTVYIIDSIKFVEGESYIIHKPININEFPHWNESFMDVLDSKECHVVEVQGYRTKCYVDDIDFPMDSSGHTRTYCNLKVSWLSKVEVEAEELEENNFDIKELF